jgi:hypothetical protein
MYFEGASDQGSSYPDCKQRSEILLFTGSRARRLEGHLRGVLDSEDMLAVMRSDLFDTSVGHRGIACARI